MRRLTALGLSLLAMGISPGCGSLKPRAFRKIQHPAPLVRARAVGLGGRQPDAQVLPALVGRLNDPDPVVRLAAHEELKKRTGQDFGYEPWLDEASRKPGLDRWKGWLNGEKPAVAPSPQASPQAADAPAPTIYYRRTIRE